MAGLVPLMGDSSWGLSTADLIQQVACLVWVENGDDHKELYKEVTQGRIAYELYNRLSGERESDALQLQCIMAIVNYIKTKPKATEAELIKVVTEQVELFRQGMKAL